MKKKITALDQAQPKCPLCGVRRDTTGQSQCLKSCPTHQLNWSPPADVLFLTVTSRCPECGGALLHDSEEDVCLNCHRHFPVPATSGPLERMQR
jgi:DNA-directed RNA polymerase subunit RPC12/RpoP